MGPLQSGILEVVRFGMEGGDWKLTGSLFFVLFIVHKGGDVTIREHGLGGRERSGLGHFCRGDFHHQRGVGGGRFLCIPHWRS